MSPRLRALALLLAVVVALGGTIALATQGSDDEDSAADPAAAATPDLSDVPDVVATVDGVEITKDEFERSYVAQFELTAAQSAGAPVDQDALKQQVAENLVDTQLLVAEAERRDYDVSAEDVESALTELAEQNGQDVAALRDALAARGLSPDEIDQEIEQQIRIDRLIAEEAGDTTPTDEDLKEVYDQVVVEQGEGADVPSFDEVKPQLLEQGKQENENAAARSLVVELRETATIDIAL